ncbi:MAG: uroporphyrinogen-III synthase [Sulfuricellaceae bacterium]
MKPLEGLGVLITRPARQNANLARLVREAGGEAILFPTLEIAGIDDSAPLYAIMARLEQFGLAIFISPNAVEKGIALIRSTRALPPALKIAAIGQGSADALARLGVAQVLAARGGNDSEALLALPELQQVANSRVVIFRGVGGRETLKQELTRRGAEVVYAECYRRRMPECDPAPLLALGETGKIGAIATTSTESLRNLRIMLGENSRNGHKRNGHRLEWLNRTPLFAPHPRIAAAAHEAGWEKVFVTAPGDDGLVNSMIEWRNREKHG